LKEFLGAHRHAETIAACIVGKEVRCENVEYGWTTLGNNAAWRAGENHVAGPQVHQARKIGKSFRRLEDEIF
jgi:hypothetical protein